MAIIKKWVTHEDGTRIPQWVKDPQDVEDYTLDWSLRLADGDFIVSVSHVLPASLQLISENYTETITTVWIAGGLEGATYPVTAHVTTDKGRQHDRTFNLVMRQK